MKIDRRGFTLIELLAAIVILGLFMVVAVPSINNIIKKKKDQMYIEDAKRLIAVADYRIRSSTDASVERPENNGACIIMDLSFLDNGEFNDPPYGGAYYAYVMKSFVIACMVDNQYNYTVQLMECKKVDKSTCSGDYCKCDESGGIRGIKYVSYDKLNDPDANIEIGDEYIDFAATLPGGPPEGGGPGLYVDTTKVQTKISNSDLQAKYKVLYDPNDN